MEALQPAREPGTGRQQTVLSRAKDAIFDRPGNAVVNSLLYGPRDSKTNLDIGNIYSATGSDRDSVLHALMRETTMAGKDKLRGKAAQMVLEALMGSGALAAAAGQ